MPPTRRFRPVTPRLERRRIVDRAWQLYVQEGLEPVGIAEEISRSWRRARDLHRIDPGMTRPGVVLSPEALATRRERDEVFRLASPIVADFARRLGLHDAVLAYLDGDGWMLSIDGDRDVVEQVAEIDFRPGALWSEEAAGTNGPGTALVEGRPVEVFASEHFVSAWHPWSCAAAPIQAPGEERPVGRGGPQRAMGGAPPPCGPHLEGDRALDRGAAPRRGERPRRGGALRVPGGARERRRPRRGRRARARRRRERRRRTARGWWRRERSQAPQGRGSPRPSSQPRRSSIPTCAWRRRREGPSSRRRYGTRARSSARSSASPRRRPARAALARARTLAPGTISAASTVNRSRSGARSSSRGRRRAAICPSSSAASRGLGRSCSRAQSTPQEAGAASIHRR